jgi:hypothetical protein
MIHLHHHQFKEEGSEKCEVLWVQLRILWCVILNSWGYE